MKPSDFTRKSPLRGVPRCVDCNAPAQVVDQPMPQCRKCYAVTHTAKHLNLATCSVCSYSYNQDEWDRCPNDSCPTHSHPIPVCALCGSEDSSVLDMGLCSACHESESRFEEEP